MNQLINWLRRHWIGRTHSVSITDNAEYLSDTRSENPLQESLKQPLNKVYYTTPGRGTFWAYIDKGRIISAKTTFIKVKIKWPSH